ncbi:hypothetical protein CC78DRAFT_581477 [Lojkania enalia]|uniref:Rad21/Rec8-like protein N-terminal domain-containing protein n=1 Tax=Lojkania enalia TaxID=147567 RepID=A0A9P4K967_9PLEO|nr:hypothetical protein CC78DRAFT_581477 [Didymosphaeria enalia]
MFYSHEVLTSRKYGVATVWLVATLGSKSNLKKINRKDILDVDVPKACQTIIDPAAPMALRLQGNLLFGVSRVYSQQCGYVLADAHNAHSAIHMMLKAVNNAGLDPEAGKAKPEQLVLQDDPFFLPDYILPPPELLADLNLPMLLETPRSGESQSLTPFASQHDSSTAGPVGGLILPSSSPRPMGEFRVKGDNGPGDIVGPGDFPEDEDNVGLLEEPDFDFDEHGNFIEITRSEPVLCTPTAPLGGPIPSDAGASARVRQEHEEGHSAGIQLPGDEMDIDLPIFGDDIIEGKAFPTIQQQGEALESAVPSPIVAAPLQRKKRTKRIILPDTAMELRNKDLADWNANYLQNMTEAARIKNQHRIATQAKKNAEYWVWGAGVGGSHQPLGARGPTPFDRFYGDNLFELLTGINRNARTGTKRDRDSGIDEGTQEESRRVRRKSNKEEDQIGRADDDEAMFLPADDEVELPREAPSALDDQHVFSAMPWNISASIRGSSAVPRSGRVGGASSLTGPHGSIRYPHGARVVSASPLHGRGQPGGLEALQHLGGDDGFDGFQLDDIGFAAGPPPGSDDLHSDPVSIQQQYIRIREALSAESGNFLAFVSEKIVAKRQQMQAELGDVNDPLQADAASDVDEVLFEEILSPAENSKMVAAQGLLMVLSLGTKGMLDVRQDESYGKIGLSLTEAAQAAQMMEAVGEKESNGDVGGVEEAGQFEEEFEGGTQGAAEAEDDHDELYD